MSAPPAILPGAATALGCGFDATHGLVVPPPLESLISESVYQLITTEITELNRHFTTEPRWQLHDDHGHAEALAIPVRGGSVVSIGNSLITNVLATDAGGWPSVILGVLAHEWAHTFQYDHHLQEQVYLWETHADYLAGWYLGQRRAAGDVAIEPTAFARALASYANVSGYFDENTHGSPAQRTDAMYAGLRLGHSTYSTRFRPDVEGAADTGYAYVKSIPTT